MNSRYGVLSPPAEEGVFLGESPALPCCPDQTKNQKSSRVDRHCPGRVIIWSTVRRLVFARDETTSQLEGLSADPMTDMAEWSRMNHELPPQLDWAVGAIEAAQRKFRTAVLIRLSRIETMVSMVRGAQISPCIQPESARGRRMSSEPTRTFPFQRRHSGLPIF